MLGKNDPTKWPEVKWWVGGEGVEEDIYNYLKETLFFIYRFEEILVSELLAKIFQYIPNVY